MAEVDSNKSIYRSNWIYIQEKEPVNAQLCQIHTTTITLQSDPASFRHTLQLSPFRNGSEVVL
jgi:hypothetical protein